MGWDKVQQQIIQLQTRWRQRDTVTDPYVWSLDLPFLTNMVADLVLFMKVSENFGGSDLDLDIFDGNVREVDLVMESFTYLRELARERKLILYHTLKKHLTRFCETWTHYTDDTKSTQNSFPSWKEQVIFDNLIVIVARGRAIETSRQIVTEWVDTEEEGQEGSRFHCQRFLQGLEVRNITYET